MYAWLRFVFQDLFVKEIYPLLDDFNKYRVYEYEKKEKTYITHTRNPVTRSS